MMEMRMLLKSSSKLVLINFLLVIAGCFGGAERTEIGEAGFYFVNLGGYQRFLVNEAEEIVIPPTIVDFVEQQDGYVFIRQVVQEYTCAGSLRTEITDDFEYWILYKDRENVLLGPLSKISLQSQLNLSHKKWERLLSDLTAVRKKRGLLPSGNDC